MFPKEGNLLHPDGDVSAAAAYARAVAGALRSDLGSSHQAIKTTMQWTKASERSVKNWLSGAVGPDGAHLVALMRHSDDVLRAVLRLADREDQVAALMVLDARKSLLSALAELEKSISRRR